jgi:hypothetical protein
MLGTTTKKFIQDDDLAPGISAALPELAYQLH